MLCEWIKEGNKYKCKHCGFITTKENVRKNCLALMPKTKRPGIIKRTGNFAKAATQHMLHGQPKCTQEEINRRFEICKTNECGFFEKQGDRGFCKHRSCGCNINLEEIYLNKLAWADQECPIGKWGKINKNGV